MAQENPQQQTIMTQHKKPASLPQADDLLVTWAREILPGSEPLLTPPGTASGQSAVNLYLLALAASPPLRGPEPTPLQLMARYLVTAWDADPTQAHTMLDALVFNAMRHPLFEVDLTPLSYELWAGFQMNPQLAFVLCIPVVVVDPVPQVPIVREPPTLSGIPMVTLRGILLGPGEIPLANARVEYPSLQRTVRTNAQGEFTLRGLPAEPRTKALRIKAKDRTFDMAVEQPTNPEDVAMIVVPLLD